MTTYSLKPGVLIVLEGLDKTGKSTQSEALRRVLDPSSTRHVHMPSGMSAFTDEAYSMLESALRAPRNGVAKQLTHLACHAESVPGIQEALMAQAVVLDRWWWSTLAYGWYSGDVPDSGITEAGFRNLIDSIWGPLTPSVVFLFDKPYEEDSNNSNPVLDGYRVLAREYQDLTVQVQHGGSAEITDSIVAELLRRDLIEH
tara:strand:+ start:6020 stop:6619 length:600 start_codon:yes stop_codon:yes gene_type:complete